MTFGVDAEYREQIDRRSLVRNVVRVVVWFVMAYTAVAIGSTVFAPSVTGPGGSSFVTTEDGVAAWRELLGDLGRRTVALRQPLTDAALDPSQTTLIVVQPDPALLDGPYVREVQRFVEDGGRLVITAGNAAARALVPDAGLANGVLGELRPRLPVAETAFVRRAVFDGDVYFADPGSGVPLLTDDGRRHAALAAQIGAGRVILLAEKSAVTNRLLAVADNAALAVGATGDRAVVFDEYLHGYGLNQGPGALPARLVVAVAVTALGALVWMWAAGRRLGTAEQPGRALPPARSEYVGALASSLARVDPDERAFGSLRGYGLELLERLGAQPGTGVSALAGRVELTERELAALRSPVASKSDAVLVGSAVTKLHAHTTRRESL